MQATDTQMQVFCDTQVRPWWEQFRAVYVTAKSSKALDDDVYARATSTDAWADARTDGPPHLLQSGNGANPDDVTNFNEAITALIGILEATTTRPTRPPCAPRGASANGLACGQSAAKR